MRRHLATYRLTRSYRHFEDLKERTPEEALAAGIAFSPPSPWKRGWHLLSVGEAQPADISAHGVAVVRQTVWEITLPIWESDQRKARALAEQEAQRMTSFHDETTPEWMSPNWNGREGQIEIVSLVREAKGPRLRHDIAIPWRTLCSVDQAWWPRDHELDEAFEAFRYLAGTAVGYQRIERWHTPTTLQLLSRTADRIPMLSTLHFDLAPITSVADLRQRFQAAILGTEHDFYDRWRSDHSIGLDATLAFRAPHRGREWREAWTNPQVRFGVSLHDVLGELLERSRGMKLTQQLNSVHAGARRIEGLGIVVGRTGFRFVISYGYEGSAWCETIACSRGNEPFIDTLMRAWQIFRTELVPDFEEQRRARWDRDRNRQPDHEAA